MINRDFHTTATDQNGIAWQNIPALLNHFGTICRVWGIVIIVPEKY